ncbi:MAG: FHA domain-containing protein [Betaproteobacteria bacterium]|nr:FHA domain-containing protein [Betaproteobacteria bacterium]
MAKLILTLDGVVLKEYALTKERTTIGRKAHNDVQIDNLAVSGEHAAIVTILNDSFLEDLGSTNGTLVNGQPIKKHFLQNGDVIEIGKYKVKYMNEQTTGTTAADFEKTMVLRSTPRPAEARIGDTQTGTRTDVRRPYTDTQINARATSSHPIPPPSQSLPGAVTSTVASIPGTGTGTLQGVIQILSGPNAGRELALAKALTTLGKPGVQVAVIAKRPQGFFITHVEGANYPIVNGKTLDAQAHLLSDHDIIELAGVKMEFFFKPAA